MLKENHHLVEVGDTTIHRHRKKCTTARRPPQTEFGRNLLSAKSRVVKKGINAAFETEAFDLDDPISMH